VFSAGLALVVTAIGMAVIFLGDRLRARVSSGWISRTIPAFSAVVIAVVGLALTVTGMGAVYGLWGS
jgi:ABC-type nickel/cobalt efflux system permease component RcnA